MHGSLYWQAVETRDKLARFLADRSQPRMLRAKAGTLHVSCQDVARRLANADHQKWSVQEISRFLAIADAFLKEHAPRTFP